MLRMLLRYLSAVALACSAAAQRDGQTGMMKQGLRNARPPHAHHVHHRYQLVYHATTALHCVHGAGHGALLVPRAPSITQQSAPPSHGAQTAFIVQDLFLFGIAAKMQLNLIASNRTSSILNPASVLL